MTIVKTEKRVKVILVLMNRSAVAGRNMDESLYLRLSAQGMPARGWRPHMKKAAPTSTTIKHAGIRLR